MAQTMVGVIKAETIDTLVETVATYYGGVAGDIGGGHSH